MRESRTDVDALDLTAERLRFLQDAFIKAADDSRARADHYAEHDDADANPARQDDQRAQRLQQPDPRRGPQAGRRPGAHRSRSLDQVPGCPA